MFKWFKRRPAAPIPARRPGRGPGQSAAPAPVEEAPPPALPEVVAEGNTQADWSAWEDSMTALDSQLQGLVPTDRVYVRDTQPARLDEVDPFSGVARKRER